MFGQDSKIQIAVLTEKFKVHEAMVERVDTAIQTLSETNQNICKMLAVHDERITVQARTDDDVYRKIENVECKVESLYKFRWQAGAVVGVIMLFIGAFNAWGPKVLTGPSSSSTIERSK